MGGGMLKQSHPDGLRLRDHGGTTEPRVIHVHYQNMEELKLWDAGLL